MERTLVIVKPDGVKRKLVDKIIERYEEKGLKVIALKKMKATKELLKKHYSAHVGKPFYLGLERFMSSGEVVAFVLEGKDAVNLARKITGATDPAKAEKGTVRGDLGIDSGEKADKEKRAIENLVHASGNHEEAEKEIKLWFPELTTITILFDTNVYGWAIEDKAVLKMLSFIIEEKKSSSRFKIFGSEIIENELKKNPHNPTRNETLEFYKSVVNNELKITKEVKKLADLYFESCKKLKVKITIEDCEIVAAAVVNNVDFIVTNNRRTMNNPKALDIFKRINSNKFMTPKIINSNEASTMFSF